MTLGINRKNEGEKIYMIVMEVWNEMYISDLT